eukprot:TRINITY_DN56829_c0_g1_i1.p1 TRINITY_DN56829_c0_g1~~TRINITY_DN56829_c0_g1_i1.p1  ORF type:complete len:495 (-),score=36.24 TRINITY_DN56829_c0_g1_i1:113-1597(-)
MQFSNRFDPEAFNPHTPFSSDTTADGFFGFNDSLVTDFAQHTLCSADESLAFESSSLSLETKITQLAQQTKIVDQELALIPDAREKARLQQLARAQLNPKLFRFFNTPEYTEQGFERSADQPVTRHSNNVPATRNLPLPNNEFLLPSPIQSGGFFNNLSMLEQTTNVAGVNAAPLSLAPATTEVGTEFTVVQTHPEQQTTTYTELEEPPLIGPTLAEPITTTTTTTPSSPKAEKQKKEKEQDPFAPRFVGRTVMFCAKTVQLDALTHGALAYLGFTSLINSYRSEKPDKPDYITPVPNMPGWYQCDIDIWKSFRKKFAIFFQSHLLEAHKKLAADPRENTRPHPWSNIGKKPPKHSRQDEWYMFLKHVVQGGQQVRLRKPLEESSFILEPATEIVDVPPENYVELSPNWILDQFCAWASDLRRFGVREKAKANHAEKRNRAQGVTTTTAMPPVAAEPTPKRCCHCPHTPPVHVQQPMMAQPYCEFLGGPCSLGA